MPYVCYVFETLETLNRGQAMFTVFTKQSLDLVVASKRDKQTAPESCAFCPIFAYSRTKVVCVHCLLVTSDAHLYELLSQLRGAPNMLGPK